MVDHGISWSSDHHFHLGLMSIGISGKIFDAIQSLYESVQCTIKVNDLFSPWFFVTHGIKQGCKISPTLFSIYINDLAQEINRLNCGVNLDGTIISVLLYADDIVLIAPTDKACRYFLGGGKCASNVALRDDMGWNSCYAKIKN